MHTVAVYLVELAYGGGEEGGWWYNCGQRCTEAELLALGKSVSSHEDAAAASAEAQIILDKDWNVGSHAHDISSTISAGRYMAMVHEGWPPAFFREVRPRYE